MISKTIMMLAAVVLIIAGFVLILFGLGRNPLLWQIGLVALVLAMLASLATRWTESEDEKNPNGKTSKKKNNPGR